jgi:glycosyltransferase involved in cell wall biosynthesis
MMPTPDPQTTITFKDTAEHPVDAVIPMVEYDFSCRPIVRGKFIFVGKEKFWIKGVTYGTFRPSESDEQFPTQEVVARDFEAIAKNGINTIRTYTPPPRWLLDVAQQHGLHVMVGLAWEQHVAFLDDRTLKRKIIQRIRDGVRACANHPAVLCFSIGNEIPPSIIRWHGHRRIEKFLDQLYRVAKAEDPEALITYVSYPTTEYLQLSFLDLICFNVYLEAPEKLEAYLARLQNIAGEKPLLMAEIGLDSRSNGEDMQAASLDWQIRTAFTSGCAGAFVFAWTDEWYRGGHDIEDWDFGLTTREREPKIALGVVRKVFSEVPFPNDVDWPKISVVVCSYNGALTIRDTFDGLRDLAYTNFEVIVVNDGSTDDTPDIAGEYDVRLISTENRGLSNARNTGWQEATGEIVAYIDDDAYPDPHWLHYLAWTFMHTDYIGVGGPNIAPPGDGPIADCIANAPGGPVHVLLTDTEAEHIPGCNMAFRRDALAAIDGFDPRYRAAGDDVDVCWRLQENVGKIGFHAAAVDWHHRRNSVKTYWKQQQGYGKAESLLEEKWPEKYNAVGHYAWSGRLYGKGITEALRFSRARIYGGPWGSALFQSIYQPANGMLTSLPLMPEWYLITGLLGVLVLLGLAWSPLLWFMPLLLLGLTAPIVQALLSAIKAEFPTPRPNRVNRLTLRGLTAVLHIMQPLARLIGRLRFGLTPWRQRVLSKSKWRWSYDSTLWSEQWQAPEAWLQSITMHLRQKRMPVLAGGEFDDWDLELRGGLLGSARSLMAIEEHAAGKQMLRFRVWPKFRLPGMILITSLALLGFAAMLDEAWIVGFILVTGAGLLLLRMLQEYVTAACALKESVPESQQENQTAYEQE